MCFNHRSLISAEGERESGKEQKKNVAIFELYSPIEEIGSLFKSHPHVVQFSGQQAEKEKRNKKKRRKKWAEIQSSLSPNINGRRKKWRKHQV